MHIPLFEGGAMEMRGGRGRLEYTGSLLLTTCLFSSPFPLQRGTVFYKGSIERNVVQIIDLPT